MTDPRREDPVLITDAQMSYEEELEVRKRRYRWTMGLRFPCIILAGLFYQIPWLAVTLLVISVPLPWIAVLIANDRLPRKAEKPNRYRHGHRELEDRPHDVIDSGRPAGSGSADSGSARSESAGSESAGSGAAGSGPTRPGAARSGDTDAAAAADNGTADNEATGDTAHSDDADTGGAAGTARAAGGSGQDPAGTPGHRDAPASG